VSKCWIPYSGVTRAKGDPNESINIFAAEFTRTLDKRSSESLLRTMTKMLSLFEVKKVTRSVTAP